MSDSTEWHWLNQQQFLVSIVPGSRDHDKMVPLNYPVLDCCRLWRVAISPMHDSGPEKKYIKKKTWKYTIIIIYKENAGGGGGEGGWW